MLVRIEVTVRPEREDPQAKSLLRRIEMAYPEIRKKIRWGRLLEVYWLDIPASREELIGAIGEIFWDRVISWVFSGNLIPSAAGKEGGILDLMTASPHRPGVFWALEARLRAGVTDNVGRTALEAFEIVLGRKLPEARACSGRLFLLEGPELNDDLLSVIARDLFCNELIETYTILPESELKRNDRFHSERVKRDIPRVQTRSHGEVASIPLRGLSEAELLSLSHQNLWALNAPEMSAVREYYARPEVIERRKHVSLDAPTDVELEIIAQTWSEHCKHKIFGATISYSEVGDCQVLGFAPSEPIPLETRSLYSSTIKKTTQDLPRPWLLSVFSDNAGIVAFGEEDAFCIKVETHNSPSALDPYGGALTGIVGVNRDILGCGLGARPVFNTNVFCVAPIDTPQQQLPERLLHPRRILDGVRRGVEDGGNKSGIPTVNGALVFDSRYLGKPLVYCGTGGFMPRMIAGRKCETKEVFEGDFVVMVGGRVGKDGIHGATFSSLALDERSPTSAVQLGDPITQKRMADFLLEARDLGLIRAITDNGAGGLSSSVGEMARLPEGRGGARLDLAMVPLKYPGLAPYEMMISESQERMTVAVAPDRMAVFSVLAERRGVLISKLGEFTNTGRLEVFVGDRRVADLDLEFLHEGVPELRLDAIWTAQDPLAGLAWDKKEEQAEVPGVEPSVALQWKQDGARVLCGLLARPNIASKEWLIRQYDHEVQGTSVIKPLHTVQVGTTGAVSGPNDGAVIQPKPQQIAGMAVACGIVPRLSDVDPYLMAMASVDEAIRNLLCVGAEFGTPEAVTALVDNFCWPDPVQDPQKAGALVRACYGLREAALRLRTPLVSGKDSMKNDFRGKLRGEPITISVPPTLLMTAIGRVADTRNAKSADFKAVGDVIYWIGNHQLGLVGSEFWAMAREKRWALQAGRLQEVPWLGVPHWETAERTYRWMGLATGREQARVRSLHDISDGGLLVSVAESLIARNFGAMLHVPKENSGALDQHEIFTFCFGEGFHSFIVSCKEEDTAFLEGEWQLCGVPFKRIGVVTSSERLEVFSDSDGKGVGRMPQAISVPTRELRAAWNREGYWE